MDTIAYQAAGADPAAGASAAAVAADDVVSVAHSDVALCAAACFPTEAATLRLPAAQAAAQVVEAARLWEPLEEALDGRPYHLPERVDDACAR